MARITAYEASDGAIFRTRRDYLQYEANLMVAKRLTEQLVPQIGEDETQKFLDVLKNNVTFANLRELIALKYVESAADQEQDQDQDHTTGQDQDQDLPNSSATVPEAVLPTEPVEADI